MKSSMAVCALTISILLIKPDCATANKAPVHEYSDSSASAIATQRKAGEVVIEPVSVTTSETGTVNFELGTLFVQENRADPKSRLIGVGFARFRALQPRDVPPTFHLPGGPGESLLSYVKSEKLQTRNIFSFSDQKMDDLSGILY
jgi:hypothetical protein